MAQPNFGLMGAQPHVHQTLLYIDAYVDEFLFHVYLPYEIGPALQDTGFSGSGSYSGSMGESVATLAHWRPPRTIVPTVCRTPEPIHVGILGWQR